MLKDFYLTIDSFFPILLQAILLIQLILCGVAPVDVNPMVGPFPDAFSEWGGKNAYLLLEGQQYWRIITPGTSLKINTGRRFGLFLVLGSISNRCY